MEYITNTRLNTFFGLHQIVRSDTSYLRSLSSLPELRLQNESLLHAQCHLETCDIKNTDNKISRIFGRFYTASIFTTNFNQGWRNLISLTILSLLLSAKTYEYHS